MSEWVPKSFVPDEPEEWAPKSFVPDEAAPPRATSQPKAKKTTATRAGLVGAVQGATGDWADEIGAGVGQLFLKDSGVRPGKAAQPAPDDSPVLREMKERAAANRASLPSKYESIRNLLREEATAAREEHPEAYIPAEIGGAALSMAIPGLGIAKGAKLAGTAGKMAVLGGVSGLGASEADLTSMDPEEYAQAGLDTAIGIGVGGTAGALGHGIQKGAQYVGGKLVAGAASRTAKAQAKAAEMAAKESDEAIASARSLAGRTAQDAYKQLEHLRELKALRGLSPEEKTVFGDLSRELGGKAREKLLPANAAKDAAATAYGEAVASRAATEAVRTAELLKPSVGKSSWELFKSYGEPLIGAYGGQQIGEMFDSPTLGGGVGLIGGLMAGRTRAGKAILNRLAKPGNQVAIANGLRRTGEAIGGVGGAAGAVEKVAGRTATPARAIGARLPGVPQMASEEARPGGMVGSYLDALDSDPERLGKFGPVIAREATPDARLAMTEALLRTDPEFAKTFEAFKRSLQSRQGRALPGAGDGP